MEQWDVTGPSRLLFMGVKEGRKAAPRARKGKTGLPKHAPIANGQVTPRGAQRRTKDERVKMPDGRRRKRVIGVTAAIPVSRKHSDRR